jgi:hypothetical protein
MKRLRLTQRSLFKLILSKKSMVERNIFSTWQPIKGEMSIIFIDLQKALLATGYRY